MLFSVILSVDAPAGVLKDYLPAGYRSAKSPWAVTETGKSEMIDGWRHRKLGGVLTRGQFDDLVDWLGLRAECKTLGMLGAPGFGYQHTPAVAFNIPNCQDADVCCYVFPFPSYGDRRPGGPKKPFDWGRMERALFAAYDGLGHRRRDKQERKEVARGR